jgi:hypothetical protein
LIRLSRLKKEIKNDDRPARRAAPGRAVMSGYDVSKDIAEKKREEDDECQHIFLIVVVVLGTTVLYSNPSCPAK